MGPITQHAGWLASAACQLDEFIDVVEHDVHLRDYPHASAIEQRSVVYRRDQLSAALLDGHARRAVLAELASALLTGPGIVIIEGALDTTVIDRATTAFEGLIAEQRASGRVAGDHYAKPGANDRVWNALEKFAMVDPDGFVDYYSSEVIALAATAWLGPAYQISSQINVVNPGGAAQRPHRDYHLGFFTDDAAERYPAHVHDLSPMLTLQGAIAHCDMPVESGPTLYLPHSHKYKAGYLAWRRPEFMDYFDGHHVQLPLSKGDAVFFNPALFHAAGHNHTTDVRRMANLLQISSAFGRAMESIDRQRMSAAIYPTLLRRRDAGLHPEALANAIAACADGYPFPTNLDVDQPVDGLAPPSQANVVQRAVSETWSPGLLRRELEAYAARRHTDTVA